MTGVGFTILVTGDEAAADDMAWACGRIFGRQPVLFARRPGESPAWSFAMRLPGGDGEGTETWVDVANAMISAMRAFDFTVEHPLLAQTRRKAALLIHCAGSLRAARPGVEIAIAFHDDKPERLDLADREDLAWRLLA